MDLTHFDEAGRARMVDISGKADTAREAVAAGAIRMRRQTLERVRAGQIAKGDVLAIAQVAAVMAAKQTPRLIPLCHPLLLTGVEAACTLEALDGDAGRVSITVRVRTVGQTGAEMEALTAVSAAALTIYDMCKAIDRGMVIEQVRLLQKSGGKSGEWRADEETP